MYTNKKAADVIIQLESDAKCGLTMEEAARRAEQYGSNRLEEKKKKGFLLLFWEQLNDPLIYILLAAVAISLFLKEVGDAAIIVAVVLINSLLGIFQEGKARKAIEALQKLTSPKALVLREGRKAEIDSVNLVPGDIVFLEAGRQIPADLCLLHTVNLKVEESALTGESVPVDKDAEYIPEKEDNIGDLKNAAFMSTIVSCGRGEGIVTETGMNTQIGKIAGMLNDRGNTMTPLQKRLGDLGKVLSVVAVVICALLFVVAVLQKRDVGEMLLTAISLAVAAVPEGLPAIVTIVLALSVSGMVRVNTLIRKLPSVETLGSVNVVCSDKTGTLTKNRMTVKECYTDLKRMPAEKLDIERNMLFIRGCILCNDAILESGSRIGDPTELALLDMASAFGLEKKVCECEQPRVEEYAFDSVRKRMTTIHHKGKSRIAYTKGAADEMIARCTKIMVNGKETVLTEQGKREVLKAVDGMASDALRVLAVAVKTKGDLKKEEDMILTGLVGLVDPARPEAAGAVASFRKAHVDTVMITGDHIDTAFAIARELGIVEDKRECITGSRLDELSEKEFYDLAERIRVYARVSPAHKVRIVETLKAKGKIVAMTGDGVNDAPSLQAADVGIAMGKEGTDVARNAADLVLTDDNFATIEKAIKEGRGIFENIRKTILFLLSSNFGEIITMMAAVFVGLPVPLKAGHILWINLITDSLPALALGVDENDGEMLMKQKPRGKKESLFAHGGLGCTLLYGIVIATISLFAFIQVPAAALHARGIAVNLVNLGKILTLGDVLARAQTHAFTVLAMSQLIHAIGMRDVNKSVFFMKHLKNKAMIGAVVFGVFLQILVTEVPYFIRLFGTVKLSGGDWIALAALSFTPLLVHELLILGGIGEDAIKGKREVRGGNISAARLKET